jgi:lysophospholipase L1-like esterase
MAVIAFLQVFLAFLISQAFAQTVATYPRGVVSDPCAVAVPQGHQLNLDFGQICKYEARNAQLPPPTDYRVIYFGDSLTELWGAGVPGLQTPGLQTNDTINRGISGQTTAQMLVRFKADVLNLKPRVVHLLMGTNDIAGNTGATTLKRIEDAISSMAEQARTSGAKVVIGSILPMKVVTWRKEIQNPAASIRELNRWLADYAKREDFVYVDYFSALDDGTGGFKAALTVDGVHPNKAGYAVMAPLAASAIATAVR